MFSMMNTFRCLLEFHSSDYIPHQTEAQVVSLNQNENRCCSIDIVEFKYVRPGKVHPFSFLLEFLSRDYITASNTRLSCFIKFRTKIESCFASILDVDDYRLRIAVR